jgi:hypothetical protein
MFTKDELELIHSALTNYWLAHNEEYERQKAKGRKKCGWHLSVMDKVTKLQSKVFELENSM